MHDYNNGKNEVSGCEHNITDLFIKAFKEGGMWNKSEFTNLTLTPKCRYVGWLDIMGSTNTMTNALKTAACFVGRLHSIALECLKKQTEVEIYSMTDGLYVVSEKFSRVRNFLVAMMRSCAYDFICEKKGFNRYIPRAAIAYGKVILSDQMKTGMKNDFIDNMYIQNVMLGVPFVKAYLTEHCAPPFGICIDESVRTCVNPDQDVSWVLNRWWNAKNKMERNFAVSFGREVIEQFKWLKRNSRSTMYPIEKHCGYIDAVNEYFGI